MTTSPSNLVFPVYTRVGGKEIELGKISVPITYRLQKPTMNSTELVPIVSVGRPSKEQED